MEAIGIGMVIIILWAIVLKAKAMCRREEARTLGPTTLREDYGKRRSVFRYHQERPNIDPHIPVAQCDDCGFYVVFEEGTVWDQRKRFVPEHNQASTECPMKTVVFSGSWVCNEWT